MNEGVNGNEEADEETTVVSHGASCVAVRVASPPVDSRLVFLLAFFSLFFAASRHRHVLLALLESWQVSVKFLWHMNADG